MNVLVADDEPVTRLLVVSILKEMGLSFVEVESGTQAIEKLSEDNSIQVCILDWGMPGCSGVEVCKWIRESEGSCCYIIMLTSKNEEVDVSEAINSGADDYLTKPFSREILKTRISAGLRVVKLTDESSHRTGKNLLTGAWNKWSIMNLLQKEWLRSEKISSNLSLLLLDIDNLSQLNSVCGRQTGDKVLLNISSLITNYLSHHEYLGHYNGGRFLIILPDVDSKDSLQKAELIRQSIETEALRGLVDSVERVTSSIGIIQRQESDSIVIAIQRAENALKQAKSLGKNRCILDQAK